MDYALQIHDVKYVFPIPDGLKELSSDIIREVLRHQPQHINGFIADYLETMLQVREEARDAGIVISDVLQEGYYFDELYKAKRVNRKQADVYATLIQAAWRGYVVRRKLQEWMKKKNKLEDERLRRRELKIEEFLAGLGITYSEARRAAGVIQSAFRETQPGKWISGELGDFWVAETVPFGQRLREGDRALGRYDRWEKEDFGEFFEMNEVGAIKYVWPRVGQLRKVLRDEVPPHVPVVEFFAMRDLSGKEQYSYLIKTPQESDTRGTPIGFLFPKLKSQTYEIEYPEVQFIDPRNESKMGEYSYVFRDDVKREELKPIEEALRARQNEMNDTEAIVAEGETWDRNWVYPRVLVRIKKDLLLKTDDEVKFLSMARTVICEQEDFTFRAETFDNTLKIIKHIMRNNCATVEEGLVEAGNMRPYKIQETGRIFPVEKFLYPDYIQKIIITPESTTAEEESIDLMLYNYIFLTSDYHRENKHFPKAEPLYSISIIRFQGYHSDYKGSADLENQVFIMGPRVATPDGKPFTYESLFWDEFGEEAWFQLLYNSDMEETEDDFKRMTEELPDGIAKADAQKTKAQVPPRGSVTTTGSAKPVLTAQTSEENLQEEGEKHTEQESHSKGGEEGEHRKLEEEAEGEEKQARPEEPDYPKSARQSGTEVQSPSKSERASRSDNAEAGEPNSTLQTDTLAAEDAPPKEE